MAQQVLGVSPALVFLADQVADGHAHVVKKDFVHFMFFIEHDDRAHGDARRFHVDQQETDAFLLAHRAIRAHQAKDHVGVLAQGGPGFLAIHDVMVAVALGRGFQRGQVGTGTGLRIALAPPVVAIQNARQIICFLFGVGESHDDGRHHIDAERQDGRRGGARALVFPDVALHGRPARAAMFDGPGRRGPALLRDNLVPAHIIITVQAQMLAHLALQVRRQMGVEEGAQRIAERVLLGRVMQVHVCLLVLIGCRDDCTQGSSAHKKARPFSMIVQQNGNGARGFTCAGAASETGWPWRKWPGCLGRLVPPSGLPRTALMHRGRLPSPRKNRGGGTDIPTSCADETGSAHATNAGAAGARCRESTRQCRQIFGKKPEYQYIIIK